MGKIPSFLRVENETAFFKGPDKKFVFFVPEKNFERNSAVEYGEYIELLGTINYTIIKANSTNYAYKVKTFDFPSVFTTKPGNMEKVKNFKIREDLDPDDYRLLIYEDNGVDEVISSIKVPQDIGNVEAFIRLFVLTGNIPKTIPYDKLHEYFLNSIKYNGNSYKITAQMFGVLLSEFCRDKHDISKPFRLSKEKIKDHNMNAYATIPINQSPKFNGPFNSLTSENWDESLVGAIINPDSKGSPLENIMMGGWGTLNDYQ